MSQQIVDNSLTWETVQNNLDKPWNWFALSRHPGITWDNILDTDWVKSNQCDPCVGQWNWGATRRGAPNGVRVAAPCETKRAPLVRARLRRSLWGARNPGIT